MTEPNKRVTCKRSRLNQHLHDLLECLYRDASTINSNIIPALKEAISSLEKYPLPLSSGAECAILKGFDKRLCRYIDSHLNGQVNKNKKSRKVSENGTSNNQVEKHQPGKSDTASNMTSNSKKNRRKNKNLVTNTEKCTFKSTFGEPSRENAGKEVPFINLAEDKVDNKKLEPNNNNATDNMLDTQRGVQILNSFYVRDGGPGSEYQEISNDMDGANYLNLSLSEEGWESFSYDDHFSKEKSKALRSVYQPIQVVNHGDDEGSAKGSIPEVNSSSEDESVTQAPEYNGKCIHNNDPLHCRQCDPIAAAAEAYQQYFKERAKRDAEEINNCVLPRKLYKPPHRSGAYAILVALLEQRNECPYRVCLTKDELIQKAQKHTDQSFTVPMLDSNCTAWTNAKRLVNKGMIQIMRYENGGEDFYTLTALGRVIALELVKDNTLKVTVNDVIFRGQRNDRVPSVEDVVLAPPPPVATLDEEQSSVFIEMPPGTFDIFLLIDKRENFDKNLPIIPNNFCKFEPRSLTIGDFIWIARSRKTGQELVLPHIVERKRMDDLASSIKDGRFHEQKFRLRKCGLTSVIYLIESNRKKAQYGLPVGALTQAVANTSILDEFNIVKTDSLDHTFAFLGRLTERLMHRYLPLLLRGCNRDTEGKELMTFEFFNKFSCKNKPLTVRDTFIKMLLQLKGLSIEKALAITNKYSTPRLLMNAYKNCSEKDGELLLSSLKYNNFSRNVGPAVSKTVYKLFSKLDV